MKTVIIRILKIIATIILSIILIATVITFPFIADSKDNVLLDAIFPAACLGGFCCAGIEIMWTTY